MRHAEQAWAGIDAGKGHHHVVVIDREGTRLLSRRVANTEPDLVELIDTVRSSAEDLRARRKIITLFEISWVMMW